MRSLFEPRGIGGGRFQVIGCSPRSCSRSCSTCCSTGSEFKHHAQCPTLEMRVGHCQVRCNQRCFIGLEVARMTVPNLLRFL